MPEARPMVKPRKEVLGLAMQIVVEVVWVPLPSELRGQKMSRPLVALLWVASP